MGQAVMIGSFCATFKRGSLDLEWWIRPMPSGTADGSDFPKVGQLRRAKLDSTSPRLQSYLG